MQANREIQKIFSQKKIASRDIKKAKKIAAAKNIQLGNVKNKFCKKCLTYFNAENSQIRIKKGMKTIICKKCGYVGRWKIKN